VLFRTKILLKIKQINPNIFKIFEINESIFVLGMFLIQLDFLQKDETIIEKHSRSVRSS